MAGEGRFVSSSDCAGKQELKLHNGARKRQRYSIRPSYCTVFIATHCLLLRNCLPSLARTITNAWRPTAATALRSLHNTPPTSENDQRVAFLLLLRRYDHCTKPPSPSENDHHAASFCSHGAAIIALHASNKLERSTRSFPTAFHGAAIIAPNHLRLPRTITTAQRPPAPTALRSLHYSPPTSESDTSRRSAYRRNHLPPPSPLRQPKSTITAILLAIKKFYLPPAPLPP